MTQDFQAQINYLTEENKRLQKEKQILFDFFTMLPDHMSHAVQLIQAGKTQEVIDKLTNLQFPVYKMLEQVVTVQKLP